MLAPATMSSQGRKWLPAMNLGAPGAGWSALLRKVTMQFPTRDAEILRLANDIAACLAAHSDVFPSPPYSPENFQNALATHDGNREANIVAHATAARSTVAKGESLAARSSRITAIRPSRATAQPAQSDFARPN